jgi:hypothetical protein
LTGKKTGGNVGDLVKAAWSVQWAAFGELEISELT